MRKEKNWLMLNREMKSNGNPIYNDLFRSWLQSNRACRFYRRSCRKQSGQRRRSSACTVWCRCCNSWGCTGSGRGMLTASHDPEILRESTNASRRSAPKFQNRRPVQSHGVHLKSSQSKIINQSKHISRRFRSNEPFPRPHTWKTFFNVDQNNRANSQSNTHQGHSKVMGHGTSRFND